MTGCSVVSDQKILSELVQMKKKRKYCSYCGSEITSREQDGKHRDYCLKCKTYYYENPLPVASTIVVNENREVLLVKRKNDPYRGMWCLPIGFAESGEEVAEAALRELEEEAGVIGEIMRLIDVDTIDNDFYGSLAIVTYEVKMTGGMVRPGDDAVEAKYFPIMELPELAWSSNMKALTLYRELFKDTWAMIDSFRELYPEIQSLDSIVKASREQKHLLSDILIIILKTDYNEISENWSREVVEKIPSIKSYMKDLVNTNNKILSSIQLHLQGDMTKDDFTDFIETGKELKMIQLPLPELITAMALSRKSIWIHVMMKKILASPLEIYTTLELNNRIIFIYDKIIYFLAKGYC
jgi:8-oxo-dGTP diphosphatase